MNTPTRNTPAHCAFFSGIVLQYMVKQKMPSCVIRGFVEFRADLIGEGNDDIMVKGSDMTFMSEKTLRSQTFSGLIGMKF